MVQCFLGILGSSSARDRGGGRMGEYTRPPGYAAPIFEIPAPEAGA